MPFVRVRQDGSISIPVDLRNKFAIEPGATYEVRVDGKGRITYIPKRTQCSLCGADVHAVDRVTGTCSYCKMVLTKKIREGLDLSLALKQMWRERKYNGV